jgi:hypothetical protein
MIRCHNKSNRVTIFFEQQDECESFANVARAREQVTSSKLFGTESIAPLLAYGLTCNIVFSQALR